MPAAPSSASEARATTIQIDGRQVGMRGDYGFPRYRFFTALSTSHGTSRLSHGMTELFKGLRQGRADNHESLAIFAIAGRRRRF